MRLSPAGVVVRHWLEKNQMAPPRSEPPKGKTTPLPPKRPGRIGSVNRRLAADARRHGRDLVGALVDIALLEADRRQS